MEWAIFIILFLLDSTVYVTNSFVNERGLFCWATRWVAQNRFLLRDCLFRREKALTGWKKRMAGVLRWNRTNARHSHTRIVFTLKDARNRQKCHHLTIIGGQKKTGEEVHSSSTLWRAFKAFCKSLQSQIRIQSIHKIGWLWYWTIAQTWFVH